MVTAQVEGEKETLEFPGLVWKPDGSSKTPQQSWVAPGSPDLHVVVDSTGQRI
jgi:hypothetical protein